MAKTKGINTTQIKIIAMILMFCDHLHQMFSSLGAPLWLTWFGRPVFPMFLFCSAIAFEHTRNRGKYLFRLFIASVFMRVLTYVVQVLLPSPSRNTLINNAFTTFFIACLYMWFWDIFVSGIKDKKPLKSIGAIALFFLPFISAVPLLVFVSKFTGEITPTTIDHLILLLIMMIPNVIYVEGGVIMAAVGAGFYVLRKWRAAQIVMLLIASVVMYMLDRDGSNQWLMGLAFIPMLLYNGEKGAGHKWLFYIFYPAHIIILYVIATLMGG